MEVLSVKRAVNQIPTVLRLVEHVDRYIKRHEEDHLISGDESNIIVTLQLGLGQA